MSVCVWQGAIPVDYHSMIKYASPEFIFFDTKGKSNIKIGTLWIPGFSIDLPENMTHDWSTKPSLCNILDTHRYVDDGYDANLELWDLGNVG